jgi:hypothetical protein
VFIVTRLGLAYGTARSLYTRPRPHVRMYYEYNNYHRNHKLKYRATALYTEPRASIPGAIRGIGIFGEVTIIYLSRTLLTYSFPKLSPRRRRNLEFTEGLL